LVVVVLERDFASVRSVSSRNVLKHFDR
jgi:hypothetical protein